jgi:hypothetical protein
MVLRERGRNQKQRVIRTLAANHGREEDATVDAKRTQQSPAAGGTDRIYWDPTIDPTEITALLGVYNAPEQHMNYPSTEGQLTVADCQTGKPVAESEELYRVISARMNGQTYACKP